MEVLHVSYECYPFAKVGGMADVVGALPKYQNELGANASVVMPLYGRDWSKFAQQEVVFHGSFFMDWEEIHYDVRRMANHDFVVYTIDVPGKFDRPEIYSYEDDVQRSIAFQRSVVHWLRYDPGAPQCDVVHCHDHHTGLVPFFIGHCYEFEPLQATSTYFTIHNGAYQGMFPWGMMNLLPGFVAENSALLDWRNMINPLASAIKCCWHFNTVSMGYLKEMFERAHGLEWLIRNERAKASGILNGIDTSFWNPRTDKFLDARMKRSVQVFKRKNKEAVCEEFDLDPEQPLYLFIGRLAYEKGADMLPSIIGDFSAHFHDVQTIILGTGESNIEQQLYHLQHFHPGRIRVFITYNEQLAHRLYAAADFLLMPSRVEPCGLNQMYSMTYGGIPIVHDLGGLHDTVEQLSPEGGNGYLFSQLHVHEVRTLLAASRNLFNDKTKLMEVQNRNAQLDFSWQNSAQQYLDSYQAMR